MGEFNSDDYYIYYCGEESLRRNGVVLIVNKSFRNAVFGCNLKNDKIISACFQGKPFNLRNKSRKNEGMEPKQKQYPVVDVTDDRSKV